MCDDIHAVCMSVVLYQTVEAQTKQLAEKDAQIAALKKQVSMPHIMCSITNSDTGKKRALGMRCMHLTDVRLCS